jgi:hypothetical protein
MNLHRHGTFPRVFFASGCVFVVFDFFFFWLLSFLYYFDIVIVKRYRYVWLFLVLCTILGTALLGPKIYKVESYKPRKIKNSHTRGSSLNS